jgi:hypothetical protein
MMNPRDERLESFLRQFRPRQPAALPLIQTRRRRFWLGGAAAATLVLAWLAAARFVSREPPAESIAPSELTAGRLAQLVDWDIEALDDVLSAASSRVLPDVERRESALSPFAAQ